jgi:hypothetical protein
MEERIFSYYRNNEIEKIINSNFRNDFFLVKHDTNHKQLFFKKINLPHEEG